MTAGTECGGEPGAGAPLVDRDRFQAAGDSVRVRFEDAWTLAPNRA